MEGKGKEELRQAFIKKLILEKVLSDNVLPNLAKASTSFSLFWVIEGNNPQIIISLPWEDAVKLAGNPNSDIDIPHQIASATVGKENFTVLASFHTKTIEEIQEPLILISVHHLQTSPEAS